MKRPTIRDIARASNLSESAVSFALNGRPGVSEATRARVRDVADTLGWGRHAAAQALSGNRAGSLGLVISRPYREVGHDAFFLQLIAGVETVLAPSTLALVLQIVETPEDELDVYRRWWAERRVDGVLLIDLREDDARPSLLAELGLPAVLAGGPDLAGRIPSVSVDDSAAMRLVVASLAHAGRRVLAHAAGLTGLTHTRRRIDAFSAAASELGVAVAETDPTDYSEEAGYRATADLVRRHDRPDAIIYDNDILALGGLAALTEAGLRVPADVAVVSWEDSPVCRVTSPTLTALSRDAVALGEHAARMLVDLINGGSPASRIEPLPILKERESTRRPGELRA